jgi:hypothetical protein
LVVHHLEKIFRDNDKVAVACIYCNYKEAAEQTVPNLIASLLKQIVQPSPTISEQVKSLYTYHKNRGTRPVLDEVVKVLGSEIMTYSRVFVVVDALDECREDDSTRAKLMKLLLSLPKNTSVMVTSRNLPSIAQDFGGAERLDIRAIDDDVTTYIKNRLSVAPRHLKKLQETIVSKIVDNINGMYVYRFFRPHVLS